MRDVGIEAEWQIIIGREEFYNATKLIHNSMQGDRAELTDEQWEIFDRYNLINARELDAGWDVVIVHDPQPAGVRRNAHAESAHWIWRCHIDLSTPNPETLERLLPSITGYEEYLFHMDQYVPVELENEGQINIIPPAIDPLEIGRAH